jgi:hypothetical protein
MSSAPHGVRLVRETNKGKRFESFLSSACDILLGFIYPMPKLYAEQGGESSDLCKIYIRTEKNGKSRKSWKFPSFYLMKHPAGNAHLDNIPAAINASG